jgi:MraZ protein
VNTYFNEKNIHSIDDKGRVLLPKDVRDKHELKKGDVLYFVPNPDDPAYVEIRTEIQWKRYRAALHRAQSGQKKKKTFRVAELAADKVAIDGQGRVMIPEWIRGVCGINTSVAVVDMDHYIELWPRENVQQHFAEWVRAFREMNDELF